MIWSKIGFLLSMRAPFLMETKLKLIETTCKPSKKQKTKKHKKTKKPKNKHIQTS